MTHRFEPLRDAAGRADIYDLALMLGRLLKPEQRQRLERLSRRMTEGFDLAVIEEAKFAPGSYYARLCLKLGAAGCRAAINDSVKP